MSHSFLSTSEIAATTGKSNKGKLSDCSRGAAEVRCRYTRRRQWENLLSNWCTLSLATSHGGFLHHYLTGISSVFSLLRWKHILSIFSITRVTSTNGWKQGRAGGDWGARREGEGEGFPGTKDMSPHYFMWLNNPHGMSFIYPPDRCMWIISFTEN